MTRTRMFVAFAVFVILTPRAAWAQSEPSDYRDEVTHHFEMSSEKMMALATAMPAELYSWTPADEVRSVAEVYAHVARYNYLYFGRELGLALPEHIDLSTMEEVTDKATVTAMLEESVEYAREQLAAMLEQDLTRMTTQYGRDVPGWAVILQLVAHMNEHVGQSVAYARMNGIVPPWSM